MQRDSKNADNLNGLLHNNSNYHSQLSYKKCTHFPAMYTSSIFEDNFFCLIAIRRRGFVYSATR